MSKFNLYKYKCCKYCIHYKSENRFDSKEGYCSFWEGNTIPTHSCNYQNDYVNPNNN